MEKVYVLVEDSAYDFERDTEITVFETKEKAQEELNNLFNKYIDESGLREDYEEFMEMDEDEQEKAYNQFEKDDDSFSTYERGCYSENHYSATIYEKEIL